MHINQQTWTFLTLWLLALAFDDIYLIGAHGPQHTISSLLLNSPPWVHLFIVFGLGLLAGHLFLPQRE